MMDSEAKNTLIQLYTAAVAAADPYISVRKNLSVGPGVLHAAGAEYPLADLENIYVIAAGKAAYKMAAAAEEALGGLVTGGIAVTKDGHGGPLDRIRLVEASHPVPDERGEAAAKRVMELALAAGENDLVLCLLSGGASALLPLAAKGLTLSDKQETTRLLLSSGADIGEVNAVRKHLSAIKGGLLARAAAPAWLVSLIVSDVIGDDTGVIASGPAAPDGTTYLQAADILRMRGVWGLLPGAVRERLEAGMAGGLRETPKPDDPVFGKVRNFVVASNRAAIDKAAELASYMGYNTRVLDYSLSGEARDAARRVYAELASYKRDTGVLPACLLTGGETTVTVTGGGLGGRNQEMALAFALHAEREPGLAALFAGTDGNDGPTDAAGAFVDGGTAARAREAGLDPASFLEDNDSYTFFDRTGGLFRPGPTGTNVMDIGIILVR